MSKHKLKWYYVGAASVVIIGIALMNLLNFTAPPFPSFYALVPTMGTALIILFATKGTWMNALLSRKILIGIGLISYSAYLWHYPLFAFARYYSITEPSNLTLLALGAAIFPLAYLSWRYVEMPFRTGRFSAGDQTWHYASLGFFALIVVGFLLQQTTPR